MNKPILIQEGGYFVQFSDLMVLLLFISLSGIIIPKDLKENIINVKKPYYKIDKKKQYKPVSFNLEKFTNEFFELDNKDSIFYQIKEMLI